MFNEPQLPLPPSTYILPYLWPQQMQFSHSHFFCLSHIDLSIVLQTLQEGSDLGALPSAQNTLSQPLATWLASSLLQDPLFTHYLFREALSAISLFSSLFFSMILIINQHTTCCTSLLQYKLHWGICLVTFGHFCFSMVKL